MDTGSWDLTLLFKIIPWFEAIPIAFLGLGYAIEAGNHTLIWSVQEKNLPPGSMAKWTLVKELK